MKEWDELRDADLARAVLGSIHRRAGKIRRPINLMEVCGTHTVAISRNGLRQVMPPNLRLLSGPGCPVCVTDQRDIDAAVCLAEIPGVILATFGDMIRVPGSNRRLPGCGAAGNPGEPGSLGEARAAGRDVRVVYSPLDALAIAEANQDKTVIFYAVGFETTAPMVAATIEEAAARGMENFRVFSVHKLVPPALESILSGGEVAIDGFICPGHVSVVIGLGAYRAVAEKYHVPAVVGGFEAVDILQTVDMLLAQVEAGEARVENQYRRVVTAEGNRSAQELVGKFFHPVDSAWRGLGVIPDSGLALREEFSQFHAERFEPAVETLRQLKNSPPSRMNGCACGDVLKGLVSPTQCRLFGATCTPVSPVGPCMVSTEGACAAYYKYERQMAGGR
ncbi:MAG: hydrogenase formation protein HypD [Firmicutes bacterium]|nr:hydrogenase formation protein HypD [Bacillota bacterium]